MFISLCLVSKEKWMFLKKKRADIPDATINVAVVMQSINLLHD